MIDGQRLPSRRGPWTTLATNTVYTNPWVEVVQHEVLDPSGRPGIYGVVSPRNLAIGVLPLFDDGTTVLVGQHRYALDAYSWEMPEGGGRKDVDPLISAARELQEEAGLIAASWHPLHRIHLSNSITDELAISFLAWGLSGAADGATPESTEGDLVSVRIQFGDVVARVMAGAITDSMTVAAVMHVELLRLRGELPSGVPL